MSDKLKIWDVVVCGGGMAGVGAAIAAADRGAKTLLIERLEILGGLGTSGGVGNFCFGDDSIPNGQGKVFADIWRGLEDYQAIGARHGWPTKHHPPLFYNHPFDHQVLPIVLQELAERTGVDLLFATDVVGASVKDGQVQSVHIHNRSLLQSIVGKQFVDATGDGILSRHAGARTLPPDIEHPQSIPPSHMLFVQSVSQPHPQTVKGIELGAPPPKYSIWPEPHRTALKMWWPAGAFDTSTGCGYSDASRAFRRRIPEFVRAFQQTEAGKNSAFAFSAPMLGQRDSVRVEGDYVLTADDLRAGRRFEDAISHGCFPLDSAAITKELMPPYQIPYRCLLVKNLKNILVAGRCFSAARVALSSSRIMATGCLMGQAAGVAAALACRGGVPLRAVSPAHVRQALTLSVPDDDVLMQRLK
jgi:hypothetical protein